MRLAETLLLVRYWESGGGTKLLWRLEQGMVI